MKKLLLIVLLLLSGKVLAEPVPSVPPLRLALSAVFLGERQDLISRWKIYLETHLQRPIVFVQRRSYRELTDLFTQGQLDAGWVCAAPYTLHKSVQRLLAIPVWQGEPLYQSYLIVSERDTATRSIADLRGKIFAYSDPESNSSFFVTQGELVDLGVDTDTFFAKTLFTYAHRKNVEAVAARLVDGARVDGYIYDMLRLQSPELIAKTRIVQKSDKYGFPPIVSRADLPEEDFHKLQETLINMNNDTEGEALLEAMGLDGFVRGDDHLFDGVAALLKKVSAAGKQHARKI